MRWPRPIRITALAVFVASCGGGGRPAEEVDALSAGGTQGTRELLVSAAASLTEAFGEIAATFEAAHPGVSVTLNLAGSSTLATQILDGAPVDVFASADESNMARVVVAGGAHPEPRIFARNRLQIAVPAGNPAGVTGLPDFATEGLRIGLCAEGVPCGDLARLVLAQAGVVPRPDSEEPDVRALLTKVELGELDAGITYRTDVAARRGSVDGVDLPEDVAVVAEYPIAVVTEGRTPKLAAAFVDFVLSEEGGAILARYGFER